MKRILLSLSLLPVLAYGQALTTRPTPRLLEGFAQAGYVHELWVLSHNVSNGYSSQDYNGNGLYAGIGIHTHTDSIKHLGFALTGDYVTYTMNKALAADEKAQRVYTFLRITPAVNYMFKWRSRYTFTAQANVGYMAALRDNEHSYVQYGLKGMLGYKAYEAAIGFNFSQGSTVPSGDIKGTWHEQCFALGLACYPGRLKGVMNVARTARK